MTETTSAARAARGRDLGAYGEACAARYLTGLGMTVLDRNWRCDQGEIDLILRDGHVLVICEVKTRSSATYGGPFEAVTGHKAMRLRRLAMHWLEVHDVEPPSVRIDVVSVVLQPRGGPVVERIAGVA